MLIKENKKGKQILLAMKKRGFGVGRWNGVGGKLDPKKDRHIRDSAIRETEEEIGVKIKNPTRVAIMDFYFPEVPKEKDFDQQVHLFLAKDWEGKPIETDEMAPKWFNVNEIPFDKMWSDDAFWMPHILKGKKLKARFSFGKEQEVIERDIKIVKTFGRVK